MVTVEVVITLITSLLVLLGALAGFVISLVKAINSKKIVLDKLSVLNFWQDVVKDVGGLANLGEGDKEKFVIDKFKQFSEEKSLDFNEEEIKAAITGITQFAKHFK